MRTMLPDRVLRVGIAALAVFGFSALGLSGCSESKDVNPTESAPVGAAQPTPTKPVVSAAAAADITTEPGKVATFPSSASGIDLAKLPVPQGAKPIVVGPDSVKYVTEGTVDATAREVAQLLTAEGWSPYGSADRTQDFKRNLVLLSATVGPSNSPAGKTMIGYAAEKIAVDLPALPDAEGLQYHNVTKDVVFDTKSDLAAIEKFYRELLAKSQWQATSDRMFKFGFNDELIFRNPVRDTLTLRVYDADGKRRVVLKHLSAVEAAEDEQRRRVSIEQKKIDAEKPLPKLKLALPAGAAKIEKGKHRLDFQVPSGTAKSVVDGWRRTLTADGWKEEITKLDDKIGAIVLRKERRFLSVDHIDPGVIPAEITVSATELELEY